MIDIEVDVFNAVYPYIEGLVPSGGFTSEFVPSPAKLPHVSLVEIDNMPDKRTRDSGHNEYSAIVTFEAQAFASSRAKIKEIAVALDEAMVGMMGFTKNMGQAIPNLADQSVFRYVARFQCGVDQDGNLYKPVL